jgi:hypothetical protein
MNQIASSENASTDAATIEGRAGSASFILTSHEFEHSGANLKLLRPALRAGDEVIVLTASEPVRPPEASWFRVVSVPGASDFTLRSHIPAVCRNEWVVLLEDHALVNKRTLDAILEVIRNKPKADLVVFLGKNLTSVSRWGWAIFLHVFALVWAPLQGPPPFSPVTSAVVRRSKPRSDARLAQGAWELQIIPRIFNSGKIEHSNDIFINHVKPMSLGSALRLGYHNARAGAALQRDWPFRPATSSTKAGMPSPRGLGSSPRRCASAWMNSPPAPYGGSTSLVLRTWSGILSDAISAAVAPRRLPAGSDLHGRLSARIGIRVSGYSAPRQAPADPW